MEMSGATDVGGKAIGGGDFVVGIVLSSPVASPSVTPPVTLLITLANLSSNSELLHPLGSSPCSETHSR